MVAGVSMGWMDMWNSYAFITRSFGLVVSRFLEINALIKGQTVLHYDPIKEVESLRQTRNTIENDHTSIKKRLKLLDKTPGY